MYLNPNNQICLRKDAAFLLGGLVVLYLAAGLMTEKSSTEELVINRYEVIS